MRAVLVIIGIVFLVMIPANAADKNDVPPLLDFGLAAGCFIAAMLVPSGRTNNSHTP